MAEYIFNFTLFYHYHTVRLFLKDNVIVKDMMAVLAAVTEIIKENGGKETETEYFAALMSALEVCEL